MRPWSALRDVARRAVASPAIGHRWFIWRKGIGRGWSRSAPWIIASPGAPRWISAKLPR